MGNNSKWIRIRIYIREEEIVSTLKLIVENLRTQDKKKTIFYFPYPRANSNFDSSLIYKPTPNKI